MSIAGRWQAATPTATTSRTATTAIAVTAPATTLAATAKIVAAVPTTTVMKAAVITAANRAAAAALNLLSIVHSSNLFSIVHDLVWSDRRVLFHGSFEEAVTLKTTALRNRNQSFINALYNLIFGIKTPHLFKKKYKIKSNVL